MQLLAFAVHDDAVAAYMQPFFAPANGAAIRSFLDASANPDSPLSKHPQDYRLYRVGAFDDNTGMFTPEAPVLLSSGAEVKPRKPVVL